MTYIESIGRRKTATARVRLFEKAGAMTVNEQPYTAYFPTKVLQGVVESPFTLLKLSMLEISAHVNGGGIRAQAEAIRHGIARALTKRDLEARGALKKAGFLMRDPRMKERRKFGLKKARRAPQWSKR